MKRKFERLGEWVRAVYRKNRIYRITLPKILREEMEEKHIRAVFADRGEDNIIRLYLDSVSAKSRIVYVSESGRINIPSKFYGSASFKNGEKIRIIRKDGFIEIRPAEKGAK